jgi:hypothetical protein
VALARDLGFDPVDAGRLAMARYTQPFAMLWIKLALVHGLGRRFAFRPPAALTRYCIPKGPVSVERVGIILPASCS